MMWDECHEWLIRGEKSNIMRMARGFFHSDRVPHSSRCGVCLDNPFRKTQGLRKAGYNILTFNKRGGMVYLRFCILNILPVWHFFVV